LAVHLHALMISEVPARDSGQVTLVGGGPGRTGLLTLAARDALRQADVILYDRLAPTEDLPELAPGVELIDVGKSPYHHPIPQRSIEHQMIMRAKRGESVVRLKGGDPFVFGRAVRRCRPVSSPAYRCTSCLECPVRLRCLRPAAFRSPIAKSASRSLSSPATLHRILGSWRVWFGSVARS
jgi:Tetrapyrrole (Corrin/Porphyrin) Methylases